MAKKAAKAAEAKSPGKTKATMSDKEKHPPSAMKGMGVRAQPLIAVRNVLASSRWYQQLLGLEHLTAGSGHDDVYDRLLCKGQLVLQLHSWDDEEHPNLMEADAPIHGHGVLLWFEVDNFDAVLQRARELEVEVVKAPHVNEESRHREIWIQDLDHYVVVIASRDGEAESMAGV